MLGLVLEQYKIFFAFSRLWGCIKTLLCVISMLSKCDQTMLWLLVSGFLLGLYMYCIQVHDTHVHYLRLIWVWADRKRTVLFVNILDWWLAYMLVTIFQTKFLTKSQILSVKSTGKKNLSRKEMYSLESVFRYSIVHLLFQLIERLLKLSVVCWKGCI